MQRNTIVKFVVQGVALGFGLVGLTWIYMGIDFGVTGIRDSDRFVMFCMTPMFLILGGIVTAVAWQTLWHFGPNAVRNVVALVVFSAYLAVSTFLDRLEAAWEKEDPYFAVTSLVPLLLAYLLYRVLSGKLIKMTGTEVSNGTA